MKMLYCYFVIHQDFPKSKIYSEQEIIIMPHHYEESSTTNKQTQMMNELKRVSDIDIHE
jgi:hypothetical protein